MKRSEEIADTAAIKTITTDLRNKTGLECFRFTHSDPDIKALTFYKILSRNKRLSN